MYDKQKVNGFLIQFSELIQRSDSILITSGKSDEDGVASILAMYQILRRIHPEKRIKMVICSYPDQRWLKLKHYDETEFAYTLSKYISFFQTIIFLDCSKYEHVGITREACIQNNVKTVCIDHHATPPDEFDLFLIENKASSTAELLYVLFCKNLDVIDSSLTETFLVGILGDTGNLKYLNASRADVYPIIQRLVLEQGIDLSLFLPLWKKYSEREFSVIQEFIRRASIERPRNWPAFTYSMISRQFVGGGNYNDLELDLAGNFFISNFSSLLNETEWGVVFFPLTDGSVWIKVRSQSRQVNGRQMMEDLGIGGGHTFSAGGLFKPGPGMKLDTPECFDRLKQWLETHRYDRVIDGIERLDLEQQIQMTKHGVIQSPEEKGGL